MQKKKAPYHHGDLRETLLKVATKMIAEKGMQSLTLRSLSERIGVSRTAPYRHFKDKTALLAAMAEVGFKRLYACLLKAMQTAGNNTLGRFEKMGVAYVQFAIENPTHYRLMATCEHDSQDDFPDLHNAGEQVFNLLIETIEQGQKEKQFKPGDPLQMAYSAWAAVHGLSVLINDGQIHHEGNMETLARFVTRTLVEGIMMR